jgi:hypothetical protein
MIRGAMLDLDNSARKYVQATKALFGKDTSGLFGKDEHTLARYYKFI